MLNPSLNNNRSVSEQIIEPTSSRNDSISAQSSPTSDHEYLKNRRTVSTQRGRSLDDAEIKTLRERTINVENVNRLAKFGRDDLSTTNSKFGNADLRSKKSDAPVNRAEVEMDLLGREKNKQLNKAFGPAKPPFCNKKTGMDIKPWEYCDDKPMTHPARIIIPAEGGRKTDISKSLDLEGIKKGSINYMYMATKVGSVLVAEETEIPTEKKRSGKSEALGHPTLVGGGVGRIAGELRYDQNAKEFYVNDGSGRYSAEYRGRGPEQLNSIANRFKEANLDVVPHYREKRPKRAKPLLERTKPSKLAKVTDR